MGRLLARFSVQIAPEAAGSIPPEVYRDEKASQQHSEAVLRRLAGEGDCIIVGRAAAIVLADNENVLNVRFDSNPERRAAQAAKALDIQIESASRHLDETDRARALYVKRFYGRDWTDARLYHLVVDSTLLNIDTCVDVVLAAAGGRFASTQPALRVGPYGKF
jgi:cytidylate kinase